MEILLPFIFLSLWKHGQAETCQPAYSQSNQKIQGHVIKTYSSLHTREECNDKCALHADCHSINYCSSQGMCEVNNANHLTNPESLVYSAGCQYVNYFLRGVSRCSNKLCSYPRLCRTEKDGQNYKCVPCEDVMLFPRKSVNDLVEHELQADVQLTAFTISMWVQANLNSTYHTPFSYATVSEDNEIRITLDDSYSEFVVNRNYKYDYPTVLDGKWHHLCGTWQSIDGAYKFYIDGVKQGSNDTMEQGHVIQKGALILGQDQDSYKGGFQTRDSFQGNLTSVNMWDRVLTTQEVSNLAKDCPTEEGNFISWSTLKPKTTGDVKLICSNHCA